MRKPSTNRKPVSEATEAAQPANKTVTPDYRRIEKLIAAFYYELAPDPKTGRFRGCGPFETIPELIEDAVETINRWGSDEDIPLDVVDRMATQMVTLGEYVLRGMVAAGLIEQAEAYIEAIALSRAECDAKFKAPREVPFTDEERDRLAKAWDTRPGAKETLALQARVEQSIVERATAEGEVQP